MIEIEFLPIGEETETGDAILCHFRDITGKNRVVLIDGGFTDTSTQIVEHIKKYYKREHIDMIVCTHPDDDHINGLFGVIESITVEDLLIHRPSEHGFTSDDVKSPKIEELITLAKKRNVNVITNAFAGQSYYNDALMIAGPTKDFYVEQLRNQTNPLLNAIRHALYNTQKAVAALKPRKDDPGEGKLTDNGGTTPRNNSSIILDIQVDGLRALMTGDAGVPALNAAAYKLAEMGRSNNYPNFFDVPHHGSRHNIDADTANRLLGPIGGRQQGMAYVSVGKKASDFPRAEVANALKRRGYSVFATRGEIIRWRNDAPHRPSWSPSTPLEWFDV